jgi:hypothetical protein
MFFQKSTEICVLQVRMNFDVNSGSGIGATHWNFPNPHPVLSNQQLQVIAVTALYARMVQVQVSSRDGLMDRIIAFANSLLERNPASYLETWGETLGNQFFTIHPFSKGSFSQMVSGKTYKISLQNTAKKAFVYQVGVAFGLEKVLIPASVCISVSELLPTLDDENLIFFGLLLAHTTKALIQMGSYRAGDDFKAVMFALSTLSS